MDYNKEDLFLNTLTFDYPKNPVQLYFSPNDETTFQHLCLKSSTLFPAEICDNEKNKKLIGNQDGLDVLFCSWEYPAEGFTPIEIDFSNPKNRYFVKRYYNRQLSKHLHSFDYIILTNDGITRDIMVWIPFNEANPNTVNYHGHQIPLKTLLRFTIKVKYDTFNQKPYLLIANDSPATLLNAPLTNLFNDDDDEPLSGTSPSITPNLINRVLTCQTMKDADGNTYIARRISKYDILQKNNLFCAPESTWAFMNADLDRFFKRDKPKPSPNNESKYIKYLNKIAYFKDTFLKPEDLKNVFTNLASDFTQVNERQVGQIDANRLTLKFGHDNPNQSVYKLRPQEGVYYGPAIKCPHIDIRIFAIYPTSQKESASRLLGYFRNGNYESSEEYKRKRLSRFIGSNVEYAPIELNIEFNDIKNPIPEISEALQSDAFTNLDPEVKYVGIYLSPYPKYNSGSNKKHYYKIKEMFLKLGIVTQCIDIARMDFAIKKDKGKEYKNFTYSLQNMSVAICAKLGGAPWLLAEDRKNELVVGIGAFKTDNTQYVGTTFAFDNTGVFNQYQYFRKKQIPELVGAIENAIIQYTLANDKPKRLVIHYYKRISHNNEMQPIEDMLRNLNLDIPVYIITINRTESEDIVLFDSESQYLDKQGQQIKSLMPYCGRWIDLGTCENGHRYLLCNNSRYHDNRYSDTDGFPFPLKLTLYTSANVKELDKTTIEQLITQVCQFSRIYWKSVKPQGQPVTIAYPAMIAEIMSNFTDSTLFIDNKLLWFL